MQSFTGRFSPTRSQPHRIALVIGIVALVALVCAVYLLNERFIGEQATGSTSVGAGEAHVHAAPSAGEGLLGGLDNPPLAALRAQHVPEAGEGIIGGFGSPAARTAPAPFVPGAGEGILGGFNVPVETSVKAHHTPGAGEGLLGGFGQ
jgi:hypothetical protein